MGTKKLRGHYNKHVDKRLRFRVTLYYVIALVMIAVVLFDVAKGEVVFWLAGVGVIVGCVIGLFASRMFHISWNMQDSKIVSRFDKFGIIILILYGLFSFERRAVLGLFVHGQGLAAFSLSVVAGTMFGRAVGTGRAIRKLLVHHGAHLR